MLAREASLPPGTPDPTSSVLKLRGSELQQDASELLRRRRSGRPGWPTASPAIVAGGFAPLPEGAVDALPDLLQLAQGLDLRRLERGPARHHRQSDPEVLRGLTTWIST